MPPDAALPSAAALLGPRPGELLEPAVAGAGGRIESARPRFVNYRPRSRIAVRYSARVAWPDGSVTDEVVAARQRRDGELTVWRWPDDPDLPGIRAATDPAYVRGLLDEIGAPAGAVTLTRRSYWPGRRAVIQAALASDKLRFDPAAGSIKRAAPERLLFLKAVRPADVERLRGIHEALAGSLPVAPLAGASADLGILVLGALPGRTISACLADPAETPPAPTELLGLLQRLAGIELGGTVRGTTAGKIARHVRLLETVLPDQADALHRFAELYGDERPQPVTTVHGDLHEEQVLARGGRVSGLLDIDDAGPGQLVDDLALMVGRVRARARLGERGRDRAGAYEQELLAAFEGAVDPGELRHRAAGALLGRATAPFRIQAKDWRAQSRARIRMATESLADWARTA